jgi:hypothetical protein
MRRLGLAHVAKLTAVVSLLCYSLCLITLLTVVAGAMVGLFISTSERAGHTAHPRPAIERYGPPAKNMEAHSAVVPGEKAEAEKGKSHKPKVLARAHNNDERWGYGITPYGVEVRSGPSSLFSTGDSDWR